MECRIRQVFSWLLLLGSLILIALMGFGVLNHSQAMAAIRSIEEAPGQMIYQSRETLKDQHGQSWQAIAFKRIRPDGQTTVNLRLVGFPGVAEIDHTQSLTLTNSLGKAVKAADISTSIFTESNHTEPNIGQYDLQPLLANLKVELPLKLELPTRQGEAILLPVAPLLIQEWQSVAAQNES